MFELLSFGGVWHLGCFCLFSPILLVSVWLNFSQSSGWPFFHCLVVLVSFFVSMSSIAVMMLWSVGLFPLIILVGLSSVVDFIVLAARCWQVMM